MFVPTTASIDYTTSTGDHHTPIASGPYNCFLYPCKTHPSTVDATATPTRMRSPPKRKHPSRLKTPTLHDSTARACAFLIFFLPKKSHVLQIEATYPCAAKHNISEGKMYHCRALSLRCAARH